MALLEVQNLHVHYPIRGGFFNRVVDYVPAVDGLSLFIESGKTYGLVGESGCGKTTTGKAIIGLEKMTTGTLFYEGNELSHLQKKRNTQYSRNVQMIFQDAHSSMNPRKRVLDILAEPIRNFMRLTPTEERRHMLELLAIVGMSEDALMKYPHEFSGGQKQRLGIARAVACNPKLIIADEPVSALDLSVQAQVLNFMKEIQREYGLAYLFISHDLGVVRHMCDTIHVMYKGRIVESGTAMDIYEDPQHIYTKRLLSAIPLIEPETRVKRKVTRQQAEVSYQLEQHRYFDVYGKVYPLVEVSPTHQVAIAPRGGG